MRSILHGKRLSGGKDRESREGVVRGATPSAPRTPLAPNLLLKRATRLGHSVTRISRSAGLRLQRFPLSVQSKTRPLALVARLEGAYIRLFRHGIEVGYLRIKFRETKQGMVWGLKDIIVHDPNMRGANLGSVLVHLFARLARINGAHMLEVLLPNAPGLYARNGFTVHGRFDITGDPATVENVSRGVIAADYEIGPYQPPQAAPKPPPGRDPRRFEDDLFPL